VDRRQALQKLAAGGAIASVGSVVLSSRDVAFAASGGTCLVGAPADGVPPVVSIDLNKKQIKFTVQGDVSCTPTGGKPSISYNWTIQASSPPMTIQNESRSNPSVKRADGANFETTDTYTIQLAMTWQCPGATQYLAATYAFVATDATQPPAISQTSYSVI
jgi:hypothetical protein